MECNKDEAARARKLAEKKLAEKDVEGAKNMALKAQKLYPELDGLPQLLVILDVHISASKRINGMVDWYRVLGVEPLADDETIQMQYRKLALIIHPDKSTSAGAEAAFQILTEAWNILSDKSKRLDYDQKRNGRYGKSPNMKVSPVSPTTGEKSIHYFSKSDNSDARYQKNPTFSKCAPSHFRPKPSTFWTTCNACKMHFEYLRTYLNNNLVCPQCRQLFLAVETAPPPLNDTMTGNTYTSVRKPAPAMSVRSDPFSDSGSDHCSATPSSSAAQAALMVQPSCVKLKRGREEAAASCLKEDAIQMKTLNPRKGGYGFSSGSSSVGASSVTKIDGLKKKRCKDKKAVNSNEREMANRIFTGNGGVWISGFENGGSESGRVKIAGNQIPGCRRELSLLQIRNMLMNKAKKEICWKLDELCQNAVSKTPHESFSTEIKDKKEERQKDFVNGEKGDANKCSEFVNTKTGVQIKKSLPASDVETDNKDADPTSMIVPDPDFHDFDQDRTEMSFSENQVWAAYDDDDGMPRYYAMIQSVISLKPFKMRISWLNSKSNNELAPLNWVGSGFPKTSGDFWRGKYEVYDSLNSFSHKVRWAKGTRGAIHIYPRKGEVWALYRNWRADWSECTPDEVIHKYDMVEVLEDYNEKTGIGVVPLLKVPRFKTVFRQHLEQSKRRTIPREEIFRFSHRVPSYLLTGQEGHNSPKGCLELDPASTPLELLQVLTEAQLEKMETAENTKEEYPVGGEQNTEKELVKNGKIIEEQCISEDVRKKVEKEAMVCQSKEAREDKMVVYKRRTLKETGKVLVLDT